VVARPSSQICGQCHGIHVQPDLPTVSDWNQNGYAYRPGDELERTRIVVQRDKKLEMFHLEQLSPDPRRMDMLFWSDGMVRVSGREYNGLIRTPCFTHGDEKRPTMSCLSCHQMHQGRDDPRPLQEWTDDQLKPDMRTNAACVQCHDKNFDTDAKLTAHTHHEPDSSGSLCYNCHMPYTTYGLLKAIRSHTVDSPTVQATLATGRPNACNQCHLDKTFAWAAKSLEKHYGIEPPRLSEQQKTIAASVLLGAQGRRGPTRAGGLELWMGARQAYVGEGLDGAIPGATAGRSVPRGSFHRLPVAPPPAAVRRFSI
jgi:hypothetical protein